MRGHEDFKRIWDGSESGWVVVRHVEDREHLVVTFSHGADLQDLKALRSVLPDLAAAPISELVKLKGALQYDLGERESSGARRLKTLCASNQLSVLTQGFQLTRYGIFNEQTKVYWLIEDEQVLMHVATEAIRRGVPVRESVA